MFKPSYHHNDDHDDGDLCLRRFEMSDFDQRNDNYQNYGLKVSLARRSLFGTMIIMMVTGINYH